MTCADKISKTLIEVGLGIALKRSGKLSLPGCFAGSGTKNDLSRAAVPTASLFKL
jgi:hypothetical protein